MIEALPPSCYVVLHIGAGPSQHQEQRGQRLIVKDGERFSLRDDLWIERLDEAVAKNIQTACEPPHFKIKTERYDRHLYAFVRRVPVGEKKKHDGLNDVFAVIALSRLIHPTSTGDRYCANVFHFGYPDSAIHAIQPAGISPDIALAKQQRDWLSLDDGKKLKKLMAWVSVNKTMHKRVHRAYWYHEYALRSYYLDMRWILVVSGLEALVNVFRKGKLNNRIQFCGRVRQLANECSVPLSRGELEDAWKVRSKLTHSEGFLYDLGAIIPANQHDVIYEKLELVLRMTVRRCLLDEPFGDRFRSDTAVESFWPI